MSNRISEDFVALIDGIKLCNRDILASEEEISTLVRDGLGVCTLMACTIAILQENSRPSIEVIILIIRKNAASEGLSSLITG